MRCQWIATAAAMATGVAVVAAAVPSSAASSVSSTTCGGKKYTYDGLAGYGYGPYDALDGRGDTLGGIGSSAAIDKRSWIKTGRNRYAGILYGLPDRGFNVFGTINYQPRVHRFLIEFDAGKTTGTPTNGNLKLGYLDSIYLSDPSGKPLSGLDADVTPGAHASFAGFPDLPVVHYNGDGFGNLINKTSGTAVVLDSEGLVLNRDGTFWVSDEYGPFVYKFDERGRMIDAIRPPPAFIPMRGGLQRWVWSAGGPPFLLPFGREINADTLIFFFFFFSLTLSLV
jgi:hypothetical protein